MMADAGFTAEVETAGTLAQVHDSRRETLERRLEDGYRRIDQAALAGADVSEWENFWIKLLGEYEDVCREHDLAA